MNKNLTINKKQEVAYKVTEFWHTIEFLSQPNFPQNSKENRKKIKKEREGPLSSNRRQEKMLSIFYDLTSEINLESIVGVDNAIFVRYPVPGNQCYICVGKVERRDCAKKLDEILKIEK